MPGWGGYDYTRLAHAVDRHGDLRQRREPADRALAQSAADRAHHLVRRTAGGRPRRSGASCCAARAAWCCGTSDNSIVHPDGTLGERGEAYAPLFAELHRIAPLLIARDAACRSGRHPVFAGELPHAMDAGPAAEGRCVDRARRGEGESTDNAFRTALRDYVTSLSQLGLQPRFVSAAMLPGLRDKALILPDTLALSPADARAIAAFAARGGVVIADRAARGYTTRTAAGCRVRHCSPGIARLVPPDDRAALSARLLQAGVIAPIRFTASLADVQMHTYDAGDAHDRRAATARYREGRGGGGTHATAVNEGDRFAQRPEFRPCTKFHRAAWSHRTRDIADGATTLVQWALVQWALPPDGRAASLTWRHPAITSFPRHLGSAGPRVRCRGFEGCLWGTHWTRAGAVVIHEQAVAVPENGPPE